MVPPRTILLADEWSRLTCRHYMFPLVDRDCRDLAAAGEILREEIVRGEAEDLTLDNGKTVNPIPNHFIAKHVLKAYQQTRNMNIIVMPPYFCNQVICLNFCWVFDAGTTARGKLKTIAREVVKAGYAKLLDVEDFEHGNQLEYQGIIKSQVENALKDGKFLEGGIDAGEFAARIGTYKAGQLVFVDECS
jgi:hypothetical protein